MGKLDNKVVVLTGNNGLLGSAIQNKLELESAIVIGLDLKINQARELDFLCDITNETDVVNITKIILNKFGKIDGWVNNAYPRTEDWGMNVENVPIESWKKNIDIHLNSYFMSSRIALNLMRTQKNGSVVNIASIYGVQGPDFSVYEDTEIDNPVAYSAIKGGIINLSRYLASYYGRYNIRVNTVSPGGIFDNQNPLFVTNYEKKVPLKRMGKPDDIAPAVAFLISDESSYITGHNLIVDGGWTAV